MTNDEAVAVIIDALAAEGIPYMLTGSLASNLYGIPRSTNDADFVLQIDTGGLDPLRARLTPALRWEAQLSFETVTATARQILEVPGIGFKIELFFLTDDPHDVERFARRRRVTAFGREMYVPSAEDVVITKLRWSRQGQRAKDRDDVRAVVAASGEQLDWDYLHRWCDAHGTRALLEEIRRSIPTP